MGISVVQAIVLYELTFELLAVNVNGAGNNLRVGESGFQAFLRVRAFGKNRVSVLWLDAYHVGNVTIEFHEILLAAAIGNNKAVIQLGQFLGEFLCLGTGSASLRTTSFHYGCQFSCLLGCSTRFLGCLCHRGIGNTHQATCNHCGLHSAFQGVKTTFGHEFLERVSETFVQEVALTFLHHFGKPFGFFEEVVLGTQHFAQNRNLRLVHFKLLLFHLV